MLRSTAARRERELPGAGVEGDPGRHPSGLPQRALARAPTR